MDAGRPVVSGLFRFHDELGLHLADAVVALLRMGKLPCFHDFAASAMAAGWTPDKIQATFSEVLNIVKDAGMLDRLRRTPCDLSKSLG